MGKRALGVAWMAMVLMLGMGGRAAAQGAGQFRIHAEAQVLEFASVAIEDGDDTDHTSIGVLPAELGLGLGYTFTRNVVGGARFILGKREPEYGPDSTHFRLDPYFEYLLGHAGIQPFLGGALRLGYTGTDAYDRTAFGLGLLGGLHLYTGGGASVDLTAMLGIEWGSSEYEPSGRDVDDRTTRLAVLLGVSAW